jgi:hypothetical protein
MSAPNGHAGNSPGKTTGIESAPVSIDSEISTRLTIERLERIVTELQVPFEPSLIEWRVTNTANDKARGQVIPYADQRAYTDRLNALVTPAGWTRKYTVHTSPNFQRGKDQKTVAKVLLTCELTVFGVGSHSATGEAWSDDENASTSAEAQAFKRAAACLGLGRYLYYFRGIWVDLDGRRRPKRVPKLPLWATPEGWRKGLRPDNETQVSSEGSPSAATSRGSPGCDTRSGDLVAQIEKMAQTLGKALYRGILKSVAQVWNPHDIQDTVIEKRVLEHMLAADRGLIRLKAALEKRGSEALRKVLAFLNIPSLDRIDSLDLLKKVVVSLESDSTKTSPER